MVSNEQIGRQRKDHTPHLGEEHFRLLVEGVVDYGIFMMDPSGYIASWNAGAERIKGYRAEDIIGHHFSIFYPEEDIAWDKPGYELKQAVAHGRFEDEGWRLRKDGSRFWANVVITALYNDRKVLVGFGKVTRDLTERRQAELELQASREQLRSFSERLQAVREEERARLSREIHDELGGILTAIKMDIIQIRRRINPEDMLLLTRLTELSELIDQTINTVRKIATELRPAILDDFGLVAAIEWQLYDFESRSGIKCHFSSTREKVEVDRDGMISVFRVFQETLTNVARHANASQVQVALTITDDDMAMEVYDNGRGIRDEELKGGTSLGLLGMRERVRLLKGELTIARKPEGGTLMRLHIPLNNTNLLKY